MNTISTPIRTTIIFGLIGGFSFIPVAAGFSFVLPWSTAFCLTIWIYLAIYSVLLIKGCGQKMTAIAFPLLIGLLTIIWTDSATTTPFESISFFKCALVFLPVQLLPKSHGKQTNPNNRQALDSY